MLGRVLCLCGKDRGFLQDRLPRIPGRNKELVGEGIKIRDAASLLFIECQVDVERQEKKLAADRVIQSTADCTLRPAFFIQEVNKVLLRTSALVRDSVLVVFGEELDSGESRDTILGSKCLVLLVISVHVCENTLWRLMSTEFRVMLWTVLRCFPA